MQLRKECSHGKFEAHEIIGKANPSDVYRTDLGWCNGGEFLPEDALLIEKVDGEWPQWVEDAFAPGPKGFSSLPWNTVMDRMLTGATT